MPNTFKINPFLFVVYHLLRGTAWVGGAVFYKRRLVLGHPYADFKGPAILISNHPSTLMDVLNVGIYVDRVLFFLANYSLFKNPVGNWLLTRLYCIPIKRKEDVAEGEERNNDVYFEQSYRHLEKGGALYIAPEGNSWMQRRVRSFKTGTARIAFGVEERNGFGLGLVIVPAGVSYTAPNLFRSHVAVQFGKPILVQDWADRWRDNPDQAVDDFTTYLEQTVRALTIDAKDEPGEMLLNRLEEIYHNEAPLAPAAEFERSQQLARAAQDEGLQNLVAVYAGDLVEAALTDAGLKANTDPLGKVRFVWEGLFLVAMLPLFLLGILFCALPCFLPFALAKRMKLYIGYDSNIKILAGLISFPLAFWGWYRLLDIWLNPWQAWIALFGLILASYFSEYYWDIAKGFLERWRAASVERYNSGLHRDLMMQREAILKQASLIINN